MGHKGRLPIRKAPEGTEKTKEKAGEACGCSAMCNREHGLHFVPVASVTLCPMTWGDSFWVLFLSIGCPDQSKIQSRVIDASE